MAKLNHNVNISGADNGFIVCVGCKTIVFKDEEITTFLDDLGTLLRGGERELRKKYCPGEVGSQAIDACEPMQPVRQTNY